MKRLDIAVVNGFVSSAKFWTTNTMRFVAVENYFVVAFLI